MTKEEEILKAATEEFFEKGYDATSTATIARKVGVTHAMVNYYYRSKEQLFIKVLDNCIRGLLDKIKVLMKADGSLVELIADTAEALFDSFNENRNFPFLLQDIARTHPEFLSKYRETLGTICADSVRAHAARLSQQIKEGSVPECTMNDIYDTVFSLSYTPFVSIPMLKNVMGMSENQIDGYLQSHRAEMTKLIRARYSSSICKG